MARYVVKHYEFLRDLLLMNDYQFTLQEIIGMNREQMLAMVTIVKRLLDGHIQVTRSEQRRFLSLNPNNTYFSILRRFANPTTSNPTRKRLLIRSTQLIPFVLKREHVNAVRQEGIRRARLLARASA